MLQKRLFMKRGRYQAAPKPLSIYKVILPLLIIAVVVLFGCRMSMRGLPNGSPQEPAAEAKSSDRTAIPGFESLTLKADTKQQDAVLFNPSENTCLFRISLILEDGTVLWTSKEVKPGKNSDPIRLSQPLEAGRYPNTVLKYECFAMDGNKTPLNGAEIKLTLRVNK